MGYFGVRWYLFWGGGEEGGKPKYNTKNVDNVGNIIIIIQFQDDYRNASKDSPRAVIKSVSVQWSLKKNSSKIVEE